MPYLYVCDEPHAPALHALAPAAPLPHLKALHATAADFFRAAHTDVAWTRRDALEALDELCLRFRAPVRLDYAFLDPRAEAPDALTAHFAGLAFDLGGGLSPTERARLYRLAAGSGLFAFVAPPYRSGASVHVSCGAAIPRLRIGDAGAYVFTLQRALLCARLLRAALSGVFCAETARAVKRLQILLGRPVTGEMAQADWPALLRLSDAGERAAPCT